MAERQISSDTKCSSRDDTSERSVPSTPDVWMLKWLQLRRESLLDGTQNVVPAIVDHLSQKGCIHPLRSEVYQQIMSEATVPVNKARLLLDWLAAQPPTVFWTFQHALRNVLPAEAAAQLMVSDKELRELTNLVQHMSLSETLNLTCSGSVLKTRETLQKFYRSRDTLLMSAGLAKGKTMPVDKIMVNVRLLSLEEVKKAFANPSFSSTRDWERREYLFSNVLQDQPATLGLQSLFKATKNSGGCTTNILAAGGAGVGKSTCFTHKAPYEWSLGRLWEHVALLFWFEFRDKSVWKANTLAELLRLSELGLNTEEQGEVVHFMLNHP